MDNNDQDKKHAEDEHVDIDHLMHHTRLPHTSFSSVVDRFIRRVGDMASWTWLILLAVIITNVTIRYVFNQGRIEFEEIQWHLYAIGFLVGLSYTLEADDHVRVDILHENMNLRKQGWVELIGLVFLLLPFIAVVIIYSVPFVAYSWSVNEISDAPGGLPARWAIKAVLPIAFALLAMAAVSRLTRVTALLFGFPHAKTPKQEKAS